MLSVASLQQTDSPLSINDVISPLHYKANSLKLVIARDHTLFVDLAQGPYLIGQPRLRIQH